MVDAVIGNISSSVVINQVAEAGPQTNSSDRDAMSVLWEKTDDILGGLDAIKLKSTKYLPKYASEDETEYHRRLHETVWRPEYEDALDSLASKPFGKDVAIEGDNTPQEIKDFAEDVDLRGNNLTVFAERAFRTAIDKGVHAILVDYPQMTIGDRPMSIAEERLVSPRPYWVSIPATSIIALYTTHDAGGRERITHVRFHEDVVERDGWKERVVQRIRVLEPGIWEIYEYSSTERKYLRTGAGRIEGQTEVPMVFLWLGDRTGTFRVKPPLQKIADMQIELYRAMSRKEEIETYAGSPMLAAIGIAQPGPKEPQVRVGPKTILFAPPADEGKSDYKYVQPDAAVMKEIRESVRERTDDIRRLAKQPMTQRSGGVTATATSVEGAKANSAVKAWAGKLKDALEQCFVYTAAWIKLADKTEVFVDTDFTVEPYAQSPLDALAKARASGDISGFTYRQGLRRFDALPPDFDEEEEVKRIDEEAPDEDEVEIDPNTGITKPAPNRQQA